MIGYPPPPVHIFIGGQLLQGWTTMSLERSKKEMTGRLSVGIFFGFVPKGPVLTGAAAGKEVMVYVGGMLAFVGTLDAREGKGKSKSGKGKGGSGGMHFGKGSHKSIASGHHSGAPEGITTHIGPDQYTITLTARGKAKYLVQSSHDHETGTITKAKTKPVVQRLVKNFKVPLDWRAPEHDMDKIRLRDGALVKSEIDRVCNEYGYFRWETRDGKLRVTDKAGPETGEPLILGDNILEFEATQAEDAANSDITVKGQRTAKNVRGKAAINRQKKVKTSLASNYSPLTIQHYTDATDEALERRARHEANTRQSDSKNVQIKVFHVQSRTGQPWDIGTLHYVEVPPEGIFDEMECISLTYTVGPDKHLETRLVLAPPPAEAESAGGSATGLTALAGAAKSANQVLAETRRAAAGVSLTPGSYPAPWSAVQLVNVAIPAVGEIAAAIDNASALASQAASIPLTLPAEFMAAVNPQVAA